MQRRQFVHRWFRFQAAVAIFFTALPAVAEFTPYEARVVATGASVHSGPGEKFYPTDTLAQGDVVEVYREKSGGWLAIRPPVNSFSWVLKTDLEMRDGGLAEAVKDDVISRIGSRLSDKHNAAQVRLKKGEVVEVIDEETLGDEVWCKIAPPAGEFRWIQAALVERVSIVQPASAEVMEQTKSEQAKPDSTEPKTDAVAPPLISSTAAPATSSAPTPPAAQAPVPTPTQPPVTTPAPAVTPPTSGPVADDLSRELAAIELRLSRMVAAPVNLWNTERLERDAAQLLVRAQSSADRDAVQVTLNKIRQFGALGHRANPTTPMVAAAGPSPTTPALGGAGATPSALAAGGDPVAASAPGGPYDAVGILRPVVSRRPGAPQFALVDERGQVLSFVTPTPDINLQPYLGRRVGVTGNRGYIAEFNRTHVTAARVAPITGNLVR